MFLKYFVIAVPILMVAFFNPLISFLSIYTYCTSEMLPKISSDNLDNDILNYSEIIDFIRQT
jgi:hypothetical protein